MTLTFYQSDSFSYSFSVLCACIYIRWTCVSTSQWMGWLPTPTLTQMVQSITSATALARTWVWLTTLSRSHLLRKVTFYPNVNCQRTEYQRVIFNLFFHYELDQGGHNGMHTLTILISLCVSRQVRSPGEIPGRCSTTQQWEVKTLLRTQVHFLTMNTKYTESAFAFVLVLPKPSKKTHRLCLWLLKKLPLLLMDVHLSISLLVCL